MLKLLVASLVFIGYAHGLCRDVTLNDCDFDEKPEAVYEGLDVYTCQQLCHDVHHCHFWISRRSDGLCELYKHKHEDYVDSCNVIAGPKTPDVIEDCPHDKDPCYMFTEGGCTYGGEVVGHLEEVPSVKICQLGCILTPDCHYFTYDRTTDFCEYLSTSERSCQLIRGPSKPDYGELDCEQHAPTTEAPTEPPAENELFDSFF